MKTQSWWLILVEGIVALALGMYLLVAPSQAWFYVGALAAVFLLVSGLIDFFGNLFSRLLLRSRARRFRGLVGIFFGGILLLLAWIRPAWMSLATAYLILGLGLIAYGAWASGCPSSPVVVAPCGGFPSSSTAFFCCGVWPSSLTGTPRST